jgi:hypothetical protein
MISLKKNFLFIHVPKTGGNSIQNILKDYSEDKIVTLSKYQDGIERFEVRNEKYDIVKHSTLADYKKAIETKTFKKLFKFSTIRNPWDMCISYFFSPHRGDIKWDRDQFIIFIQGIPNITHYIREESIVEMIRKKAFKKNTVDKKSIDCDIDFLIKFENIHEDFNKVCEILEIPFNSLPHRNKSKKQHYTKYYDDELIEIVKKRFSAEISYANYIFGK